jgi:hypothetical protein
MLGLELSLTLGGGGRIGEAPPLPVRAVASRLLGPPQQIDPTKTYIACETWHRLLDDVEGQLEVWWPNFRTDIGGGAPGGGASDQAPGSAATGTARITYTDADSGDPISVDLLEKAGGTTALTASDGGWFKTVANINATAGSAILIRIVANFPSGVVYSLAKADIANGDKFAFGTSPYSLGDAITNSFPSFRAWYGPASSPRGRAGRSSASSATAATTA